MVEEKLAKVTLIARNDLLKEMKHIAIDDGTTLTEKVNEAFEQYIQRRRKKSTR